VALTPTQITNLRSIESSAGSIPSINAAKLASAGLVEKTGEKATGRGFSHVRITEAGKQALAAA